MIQLSWLNQLYPWQRFILVGGLNTLSTYFLYLMLKHVMSFEQAYFIAYFTGILVSYAFNRKLVFEVAFSWKTFIFYPLVYLGQYIISASLLKFLVKYGLINDTLAPLVVTVAVVPITFLMTKFIFQSTYLSKENYH